MRVLATASAVLFLTVSAASAQTFDWTRFYAGPFASFGFGESTLTMPGGDTTFGTAGFGGGLVVGNTYDFNSFVVGGEFDIQAGGLMGTAGCPGSADTCQAAITWMSSVRAKAGIGTPVGLFYGTVGPSLAGVEVRSTPSGGAATIAEQTRLGFTAGFGAEIPISDKVTIGAEYAYTNLWAFEESGTLTPGKTTATTPMHAIRAGARFSF